jgi:hypothetical protein
MDNFYIEATGYGITEDDALKNAKRVVLVSVLYDQDLQHTDKFVQPGERFDRLAFTANNTFDPQTGFVNDLAIQSLLQIADIFGPPDILSTNISMEGGQVSTQITVKIEIQTDTLRAKLIEDVVLTCIDPSATAPCKDVTSALIPYPTLKFSKLIKEPENWKGHPLYPLPWKNPPEKEDANTIYIPAEVHCVALDERYGSPDPLSPVLTADAGVLDPTNFKAWWYKVKILEGDMKGQVGWAQVQSSYHDDVVLQLLDPEQSQDWMMKQDVLVEEDDPEPPVLFDKSGKRIPPTQKMRPSLSLNPDEYPKYTTHVVRVPQNFDGLRDVNPQGKALIYSKPGHGRQLGFLDNNTPIEIVEPNVGKTCEWHKVRLNNTSPINALNLQTQGKIKSLDQAVYIYAPYTLILRDSVFKNRSLFDNADDVDVPYYNLPFIVPTPEDTQERQTGQVTGVEKSWITVATCAPWIAEYASETNRNYWRSEYNIVVKINRPAEEKTPYSVWAERLADVEDPTDENDVHQKKDPETIEAEGAALEARFDLDDTAATVPALGDTPEEQQITYDAGRSLGLLTLLKFYDKEYDLLTVMHLSKLPYFVKVRGAYVDDDIPRGPIKFLISVPMRFFDAIPHKQVPFQLDRDSRLDEYIEEEKLEREVAESLEDLNKLEDKLGTEGIGASIYKTFHGKDLNEEIQKVVNRIEINRVKALAVDNPRFEGQKVFFSSAFYVKKMQKELRSLKRVFKYYDKKIKNAKEKRSYIFPGFSAPLDLNREAEILDEFFGQLQEFLALNNYAYKTRIPANRNDEGSPSSPTNKSIIEFGWNEKFEILYVLFNGQHLRVGFECATQTEPFSLQRTSALIHRMPAINKTYLSRKRKKTPPEEWVKKNIYPAAVIIPSVITTEEKKEEDVKKQVAKMNETSVKEEKDVLLQQGLEDDEAVHKTIAKEEKDKKQDNKDSILSPKNIGKALKVVKTVNDAYDLVLNQIGGLQPMIDEIAVCLTGESFDIEEQIYNMILEPLFEEITGQEIDIESIEVNQDVVDAKEFLMDVFTSVEYDCLLDVLQATVQFVNEVEPTPKPEEEQAEILNGQGPPDYTNVSGDEIIADFIVDGTTGGTPSYLPLSESPTAGEPVYEIVLPATPGPGALAYITVIMYKNASVNSEQLAQGVQGNKAKVLSISPDGYFSEVQITSDGKYKDLKGFVDARTIVASQPNLLGGLRDGSQVNKLKNPSDDTKYFEDGAWSKVEVKVAYATNPSNPEELWPDETLSKNLNGKQGWVPTAFLKPISEEAQESANASKILLQKGAADKKNGLFNEVFVWQMYLIHSVEEGGVRDLLLPDIPIGSTKSANKKLPAKYNKKYSWAFFGNTEKSGKLFGDRTEKLTEIYFANKDKDKNEGQPNPINKKDFVTNEDFAPAAEFFKNFNTKKFEKELSEIQEELSLPQPMTVLGAVTYPPPGFYTGKRSKCDWKYVAVVRAATEYEIARKKKNKGKIARLKKKLSKRQLAYQTCMGKNKSKVYGEKRTFLSGGDPTTEQILRTDAYLLNSSNISEECDKLYKELVTALGGDPNTPPGIQQGLTWPGEANATKNQKDAFEKWRACISKTVKEKEKALKEAAAKDALAEQQGKPSTVTSTSELYAKENNEANPPEEEGKVYAYYPVPQNFDQLVRQLTQWNDWPDNIEFIHDDPKDTAAAFLKAFKRLPCSVVFDKLLEIMLDQTEERYPLRAKVIRTTLDAALTLAEQSLTVPNFKPFTTPESPRLKTDETGSEFSRLVKQNFKKIARNTILNAVQECLRLIKENCIEPADDGTRVSPLDLFDADTVNKLNNLGKKYGLLDPGLSGSISAGDFDFVLFLKTVMSGLSVSQKCSILIGDLYREDVMDYIQARIATFYPAYFNFFSKKENMKTLFNALTDIIDPTICADNRAGTNSANNIPANASILYGDCPPDINRSNRLRRLINAGLTSEQAEKQIAREIGDNFRLLANLQNLQDNLENAINKNTEPPCKQLNEAMRNNKGVERMLDQTLDAIFNPIEMMFSAEARQFIPQLTNPGAYEVPLGTDLVGSDGKLDADAIAKLAQAGQDAAKKSSHTTKQAAAFTEAMRTIPAYKIETGSGTHLKPEYFKNPDEQDKDWQFNTRSKAEYYTDPVSLPGGQSQSAAMIEASNQAEQDDLAKYLGKTVKEVQVPAKKDFTNDLAEKATPPVAPVLRESLQSPETIERNEDMFTFDMPDIKDIKMSYRTLRTRSNSDSFYLNFRTFSKDQRGILRLSRPITITNNGKVPTKAVKYMQALQYLKSLDQAPGANSPQKGFFTHYIGARFKSDFGGILNETDSGAQPQLDLINTACPKLFDVMTEKALEKSLHVVSQSKYFDVKTLKSVNFTPTTSDLMEDCEASMMMGFIDASLINLTDIRQNAKDLVYNLNDVCNLDTHSNARPGALGPIQEAACDASLHMFMRVSIAENILNGFFAFTQYNPQSIMKSKLMESFLFKKLKDDLLSLNLYARFKDRAANIVDRRRQTGEAIDATSKMECLRFLFRESIKPVNDKFDLLLKNKTDSAEMKFLRSLRVLDSASRLRLQNIGDFKNINLNPRFYKDGNFILNPAGDYFVEQFIKVVDHYDEEGNALLDKLVVEKDILSYLTGDNADPNAFYNKDGTRKEHLRGFVSVADWTSFISRLHNLAGDLLGQGVHEMEVFYKLKELLDSNLYELFSEISIGIRVNYAIGPEDDSAAATEYRKIIDQTMEKIATTKNGRPSGGVISYRNKEKTDDDTRFIYTVPLAASEISFQKTTGQATNLLQTVIGNENIFAIYRKNLYKQLIKKDEFSALMKYLFPINRFASLSTLYSMIATKATLPSKDMFTTTKYLIKRGFDLHSAGDDKAYEDPWLLLSGGNAANQGFDEFNPFREMILKLIVETPLLILKGVAEVADPNIQITKKVYEGINMAAKLGNELLLEGLEDDYKEATKDMKAIEKPTFDEWAAENDIKIPDTNINVSPAIAPLISLMMLPSMMPYGVGFPPPFMFGPGIGPPMTPLAIPYLAGGLISDEFVQSQFAALRPPKKRKPDCPSPFPNPMVLLPPPEKDYDEGPDSETINDD